MKISTEDANSVVKFQEENIQNTKLDKVTLDAQEIINRMTFNPTTLVWNNYSQIQPTSDRWLLLWCNLGHIAPNLILTYRDATGYYDMPNASKKYPVKAWAYIDLPSVDEKHLENVKQDLQQEQENKTADMKEQKQEAA